MVYLDEPDFDRELERRPPVNNQFTIAGGVVLADQDRITVAVAHDMGAGRRGRRIDIVTVETGRLTAWERETFAALVTGTKVTVRGWIADGALWASGVTW